MVTVTLRTFSTGDTGPAWEFDTREEAEEFVSSQWFDIVDDEEEEEW